MNCRIGGKDPVIKAEVNLFPFADASKVLAHAKDGTVKNYKGCLSPTAVCADKNLNPDGYDTLHCGDETQGFKFLDLYGCNEKVFPTCYGGTANVCGCPGWSLDEQCTSTNPVWEKYALPYYEIFHALSPMSYTYAFDDKGATFQGKNKSKEVQVNYTITFCPK